MFGVRKAYRELVKSVCGMQQENDQLKAENARLRSELESVGVAAYLYGRDDLLAENAKLRELLDYAFPIAMYAASTEEGDRMRELMRGIGE